MDTVIDYTNFEAELKYLEELHIIIDQIIKSFAIPEYYLSVVALSSAKVTRDLIYFYGRKR